MSTDRALDGWELVQRQGEEIAQKFSSIANRFGSALQRQAPAFDDKAFQTSSQGPQKRIARFQSDTSNRSARIGNKGSARVSSPKFSQIGHRLDELGVDVGDCVGSLVNHLKKHILLPFQKGTDQIQIVDSLHPNPDISLADNRQHIERKKTYGNRQGSNKKHIALWRSGQFKRLDVSEGMQKVSDEEIFALFMKQQQRNPQKQMSVNVNAVYDSRTEDIETSVSARGSIWRAQASRGGTNSFNGSSPPFLFQIGPVLFLRETTLLFPIHLSKQHLLWYSFDRKNKTHSVCPTIWSKHRNWLFMSMVSVNRFNCSFMDFQFPNGRLTYVAGEGLSSSVFFPVLGGAVQGQSHTSGSTKMSFSKKMSWGTTMMSTLQLPEKSVSVDVVQPLAWHTSGIMVRPSVQIRVSPTFGGRNAGWRSEAIYSPYDKISCACGYSLTIQPTAYASVTLGRSKENDSGNSGLKIQVETPLENVRRASFSLQLTGAVEF